MLSRYKHNQPIDHYRNWIFRFFYGVWFFPAVLTIILLLLTVFKLNGSSIGIYHIYFEGNAHDSSLVMGQPRSIRSDEWIVNTQLTIAQKNNNFAEINNNIGNGENMSVLLDVPYRGWSEAFKPHNLSFFVLPFEHAFAFKWWVMAYLLILSCYSFTLALLPNKKLVAVALSIALLFSPFVQWWYQFSTLESIYYSLFIAGSVIYFLREKRRAFSILWLILISYLLVCFALVLYPPFQIPCGIALAAFIVGYLFEERSNLKNKEWFEKLTMLGVAVIISGLVVLAFVKTESNVIHSIQNTAYPGKRVVISGGYDFYHLFSGNLDSQLLSATKAQNYQLPVQGLTNQSEDSNFILLIPFLFLPSIYLLYARFRKNRELDLPLVAINLAFLIMLAWLFVPDLGLLGSVSLLHYVPLNRLIIGLGILNLIQLVLVIRNLNELKINPISKYWTAGYVFLVSVFLIMLDFHAVNRFPGFMGYQKALLLAIPIPVVIYLVLRRYFRLATLAFLAFSLFSCLGVNPLYRGTSVVSDSKISKAIVALKSPNAIWASETIYLENFPQLNGAHSITGVYAYPQLSLWNSINNARESVYNRYAHVNINLDRDTKNWVATSLVQPGADHFAVVTESCGSFMRDRNVRYILTDGTLNDSCVQLVQTIRYPVHIFYIYEIK